MTMMMIILWLVRVSQAPTLPPFPLPSHLLHPFFLLGTFLPPKNISNIPIIVISSVLYSHSHLKILLVNDIPPAHHSHEPHVLTKPEREKQDEEELYEPYDARLATRLQSLHSTLESETLALAELRRNAPLQAAEVIRLELEREAQNDHRHFVSTIPSTSKSTVTATAGTTGLRSTAKQDEEQQQKATMKDENEEEQEETKKGDIKMSNADDDVDVVDLELLRDVLPPGERRREMERNWGRALEELIQLKGVSTNSLSSLFMSHGRTIYLLACHFRILITLFLFLPVAVLSLSLSLSLARGNRLPSLPFPSLPFLSLFPK